MSKVFLSIVNMGISAGWIVITVAILRLLLKKAPRSITVALWGIVALRLVCPFSFESVISLIPSAQTINPDIIMSQTPEINSGVPIINEAVNPIISESLTPQIQNSANPLQIWVPVFAVVWLTGCAALLAYTLISYLRLRKKIGTAVLLRENIYQSEAVISPFVLGIVKPKIYLPFNMSEQNESHVIAHEQAHLRRKDHLWKPLGFLLLTVYWFNPLIWLGYVLLCRDIELACDEKVIKELSTEQRADYSQALLGCSVNRRMIAACPLAFGEVGVKQRIKSILNYKKPAFWVIIVATIALAAASACLLTNPKQNTIQNIGGHNYEAYKQDTVNILKYDGESYEAISAFDKELLSDLLSLGISKKELSLSRSEERDKTNTLVLRNSEQAKSSASSYLNGLYICFNSDFTEVWVNDGVKPTFSYKVLKPEKATKTYNALCRNVSADANATDTEELPNGTIQFYSAPTDEHDTPIIEYTAMMSEQDLNAFLDSIKNQKWINDAFVDRLAFSFDCRIAYDDFIYVSFEQKIIYCKEHFTELTDSEAELIKSYCKSDAPISSTPNIPDEVTQNPPKTQEPPVYTSTVTAPKEAYIYKGAVVYKLTDSEQIIQLIKTIESWYIPPNTWSIYKTAVDTNLISDRKIDCTAIEFVYDGQILFGGQAVLKSDTRRILVTIPKNEGVSELFEADGNSVWKNGPLTANGAELEELVPDLKCEVYYTSKATAPDEAYLYKDGVKYRITDSAQTLEIAKTIESWRAGHLLSLGASLAVTPDTITDIKRFETALEFIYYASGDNQKHYKFIPITGKYNNLIFGAGSNGVYASGPAAGKRNYELASYLPTLKTELYVEPPYTSTVAAPKEAYLYKNGIKYRVTDNAQLLELSKEVESWYANSDELPISKYIADSSSINHYKESEVVIELIYDQAIIWNGKYAINDSIRCLQIPTTGSQTGYVYCADGEGIYYHTMLIGLNYKLEQIIPKLQIEIAS